MDYGTGFITLPSPPATLDGVVSYLQTLYSALNLVEANRLIDTSLLKIRMEADEPPDSHPGMMWLSGTSTYDTYCKVRLDETEPLDAQPGMWWYPTSGGTASGTRVLRIRNDDNTGWQTFISAESPSNDFRCYVSSQEPMSYGPGFVWLDVPAGGTEMDPSDSADYTCRAYVGDDAPSPASPRMIWVDT